MSHVVLAQPGISGPVRAGGAQQVIAGVQDQLAATATRNCTTLRVLLTAAETTSNAHKKATGFPNDALVAYIQSAQHQAGCPAKTG